MGYMRHHGLLVTGSAKHISKAKDEAVRLGMSVSAIHSAPINDYDSFAVFPDGSKEGWNESDLGDAQRFAFKAYLHRQRWSDGSSPLDWVEVFFGDDDREVGVVDYSDSQPYGDNYTGPHDLDNKA